MRSIHDVRGQKKLLVNLKEAALRRRVKGKPVSRWMEFSIYLLRHHPGLKIYVDRVDSNRRDVSVFKGSYGVIIAFSSKRVSYKANVDLVIGPKFKGEMKTFADAVNYIRSRLPLTTLCEPGDYITLYDEHRMGIATLEMGADPYGGAVVKHITGEYRKQWLFGITYPELIRWCQRKKWSHSLM